MWIIIIEFFFAKNGGNGTLQFIPFCFILTTYGGNGAP